MLRSAGSRGDEIVAWLAQHPEVVSYAIIDDDDNMLDAQMPYLVQTCRFDGCSWANAVKLAEVLGISIDDVTNPAQHAPLMAKSFERGHHSQII